MSPAPIPSNEAARLDALWRAQIMDTPLDPQYDTLAELAALAVKAPSALVVLVDRDRAWVKARLGTELHEVPRPDSFCAHVVHCGEPILTLNAAEDARFCRNPSVTGSQHIRFYAGCPIVVPGTNLCLGALCVIDRRVWHSFDNEALRALDLLAKQVARLLHLNWQLADERRTLFNFVAKVSHELRTPIHGILGCADTLRHQLEGDAEVQHYLEAITSSATQSMHVMNGILDFSRLHNQRDIPLEPRTVSLRQCIEGPLKDLRFNPNAQQLDIGYELDEDLEVEVDSKRLQLVLANLLSNAVRFTVEGSVRVVASSRPAEGHAGHRVVRFEVRDTGVGVPPCVADVLFQPFRQGDDSPTRVRGGCGLGLAVCRGLCEALGGDIWLDRKEGRGSTFGFTIQVPARSVPASEPAFEGRTVLVVDPNTESSLAQHCKSLGLQVHECLTMTAANAVLHRLGPSAIHLVLYNIPIHPEESRIAPPRVPWVAVSLHRQRPPPRGWPLPAFTLSPPVLYSDLKRQLQRLWPAEEPQTQPPLLPSPSSLKIAVVDDNPVNCAVLNGFLKRLGSHSDLYSNGQEVVAGAEDDQYDVVFMDLEMPVMDGFEATCRLRRMKRAKYVVAVTANGSPDVREACMALGMDEMLEKPISFQDVERAVLNFTRSVAAVTPSTPPNSLVSPLAHPLARAGSLSRTAGQGSPAASEPRSPTQLNGSSRPMHSPNARGRTLNPLTLRRPSSPHAKQPPTPFHLRKGFPLQAGLESPCAGGSCDRPGYLLASHTC
eukprot:GGOE01003719.1.p1 GENE.GGOE01003719.1~~GGOE01003719.1.p1  ORF type:complete len:775 (+),score=171.12 GGOE01003719.1:68-2392(+)